MYDLFVMVLLACLFHSWQWTCKSAYAHECFISASWLSLQNALLRRWWTPSWLTLKWCKRVDDCSTGVLVVYFCFLDGILLLRVLCSANFHLLLVVCQRHICRVLVAELPELHVCWSWSKWVHGKGLASSAAVYGSSASGTTRRRQIRRSPGPGWGWSKSKRFDKLWQQFRTPDTRQSDEPSLSAEKDAWLHSCWLLWCAKLKLIRTILK